LIGIGNENIIKECERWHHIVQIDEPVPTFPYFWILINGIYNSLEVHGEIIGFIKYSDYI
jgi:hypothetical protein